MSVKVVSIFAHQLGAREQLILDHLDLVRRIARKVKARVPPCFLFDDLVQEGTIGLIQAARQFDPASGVEFGAFARVRIRGQMLESVRRRHWNESTRPPINEHKPPLELPLDFGAGRERHAETADPRALHAVERHVERRELRDQIRAVMATLSEAESALIEMYYGQDAEIQAIAGTRHFPVKASRVSQIHTKTLHKLRAELGLRGYRWAA